MELFLDYAFLKIYKYAYFGSLAYCRQLVYAVIQTQCCHHSFCDSDESGYWYSFLKINCIPSISFASLLYLNFGTLCKLQVLLNRHWTSSTCLLLPALPCDAFAFLISPVWSETTAWSSWEPWLGKRESPCKELILSLLEMSLWDFCPLALPIVVLLSQLIFSELQTAFQS